VRRKKGEKDEKKDERQKKVKGERMN